MNTNTTSTTAAATQEIALGWTKMPTYGEVMPHVIGTAYTDVKSSMNVGTKSVLQSFWSTLSNLK